MDDYVLTSDASHAASADRRTSGDPRAYRRLAAAIREKITSGTLPPGEHLPSITVLAREHGRSRAMCGHACQVLEAEGLVKRYPPGLGYFVV